MQKIKTANYSSNMQRSFTILVFCLNSPFCAFLGGAANYRFIAHSRRIVIGGSTAALVKGCPTSARNGLLHPDRAAREGLTSDNP
jgi:hypothetical protein